MSENAIRVTGLGKRYRLRLPTGAPSYRTIREDLLRAPRRLLARLKRGEASEEAFWALKNVSFELPRGEVLGVIGRNGAGKSTLLKILSRTVKPTEGAVDIYGRVGSLLEVGTGFHPELTGRENIYLSGALLGMRRHEVRRCFDAIVSFAELERFVDTPCKHYSSGMYLRLGFAVAAHLDAEILLLDEVLAVGDVEFQRRCASRVGELAQGGRTVLLVSHDLGLVHRLAIRSILLRQGTIAEIGNTAAVIAAYRSTCPLSNSRRTIKKDEIELVDFSSVAGEIVGTHSELQLMMGVRIYKTEPGMRIGFDLVDEVSSQVVFRTYDDDMGIVARQRGYVCYRASVPGNMLRAGSYRAEFIAGVHARRWITRGEAFLRIELVNTEGVNSTYGGERPGAIMPNVRWEMVANS